MITPQLFNSNTLCDPSPVVISILGSFRLTLADNLVPVISESKSEHLLVCLALANQHKMARARLIERVWPHSDPTLAGQALNSLTHQLNKLSSSFLNGTGMIVHENGYYRLNLLAGISVDVDHFVACSELGKRLLLNGDKLTGIMYCEQALMLYQGDLCCYSDIHTAMERERLRVIFLDLLICVADYYYTNGDPSKALSYTQRILIHDPCREDAHRQAMRCYVSLNQRSQALRQYRLCSQALEIEFDAKPEPTTVALFEQIRLAPASI